jgi:outer membrane protein assembly factor BamB
MRAVVIRCPECGAQVNASPGAPTATCAYCGTTAQIQRRTGIFQRPEPRPAPPPELAHHRVAVERASRIGCAAIVAFIVAVGSVIFFAGRHATRDQRVPRWDGAPYGPVLVELTGDGVADVIGRVWVRGGEQSVYLAAFDGASGERLWRSEPLGSRSDIHLAPLGLAADVVLIGDGVAGVTAIATADGSTRWTIRLSEKVDRFCAGADGHAGVRTADRTIHAVSLASGALAPAPGGDCAPLPSDRPRVGSPDVVRYESSSERRGLGLTDAGDGLRLGPVLELVSSGAAIGLAHRSPGSRVPMLAAYRWPENEPMGADLRGRPQRPPPEVLWTAVVPTGDPLGVKEGEPDPDHVAIAAGTIVVAYELRERSAFRLAAFSLADGSRRWDVPIPGDGSLSVVAASDTHAFVSRWDGLNAFELDTGEHVYTIP